MFFIKEHEFPNVASELYHESSIFKDSKFYSTAITTVLEDTLSQLIILRNINNRNTATFDTQIPEYKNVDERFASAENFAETRLPNIGTNYDKLACDINSLINLFQETSDELVRNETFSILKRFIVDSTTTTADDKILIESKYKNRNEIRTLKRQYRKERKYGIESLEKTWDDIQNIKFELENAAAYGRHESNFYTKWENTRVEQNNLMCKEQENLHDNTINETKEKIDLELKCHLKFDKYIDESRNDMIDEINYWVKRYDDETETREADMIRMKSSLEDLSKQHAEVLAENEKRQKEMALWKEYKKVREIKRKRAKVEKWASMIIQAWWRAMMVRKRLGPYKKGKGKKGKGKK